MFFFYFDIRLAQSHALPKTIGWRFQKSIYESSQKTVIYSEKYTSNPTKSYDKNGYLKEFAYVSNIPLKQNLNMHCTKNEVFQYGFFHQMWPNPQFPADFITFTEEILNGTLFSAVIIFSFELLGAD